MNIQSKWYVVTKDTYVSFEGYTHAIDQQAKFILDGIGSVVLLTSETELVPRLEEIRTNLREKEATA
jgi:hypothetical protein